MKSYLSGGAAAFCLALLVSPHLSGQITDSDPTNAPQAWPGDPDVGGASASLTPSGSNNPTADFFVLKDRQKYIGLTGYFPGIEYDAVSFSIIRMPQNGRLMGTPPNLLYVPNAGFTGVDSFMYMATIGASAMRRTVSLSIDAQFISPQSIPAPPFGVSDTHFLYAGKLYNFGGRLGPYRDAGNGPYTHFVDFNKGDDTANPFGTLDNPRRTIPSSIPGGSVVEMRGTYFGTHDRLYIRGNGTASAPIFIRGGNALSKAVLRSPMSIEGNYVICENLEFDCQDFGVGSDGANWFWVTNTDAPPYAVFHHVCLRHSLIRDQPTSDLGQNPSGIVAGVRHFDPALNTPNLLVQYIVIYDVEVRNFATWNNFTGSDDYSACLLTANSQYCWVLDCHFHHLHGPALGISRANAYPLQPAARFSYLSRNYIHNCKESALDFKNGTDSIFSQNICHTFRKSDSSPGFAMSLIDDDQTTDFPGPDNVWLLFNIIYDSENGINHELRNWTMMPSGKHSRSYIVGNLVFDVRMIRGTPANDGVAIRKGQLGESRIIGNTIYNCDQGIWLGLSNLTDAAHTTQAVRNNAIVNLTERYLATNGLDALHIYVTPPSILPYTTIDHNLHYENTGRIHFTVVKPGMINGDYYSVAQLIGATGLGALSVELNPQFIAPTDLNFHLTDNGLLDSAGSADDAYTTFRNQFGFSIDYYLDGTPKPPPPSQCVIGALPVGK